MKKYFSNIIVFPLIALVALVAFNSCTKDSDGANLSSPSDKMVYGKISVDSAANGTVIYITGSGLGAIDSIIFSNQNVPATITPTLNTSTSVVFSVPDTAWGGTQNIILTNTKGVKLSVPFKVLAFPKVSSVSPGQDFITGTTITLTGTNLFDVVDVKLTGTNNHATIVSKSQHTLIVQMPSTTVSRATLDITNATGTSTTTQEFVSVNNADQVFTDDWQNGFAGNNWGWGFSASGLAPSTDTAICGSYSLKAAFDPSGSWGGIQQGNGYVDISKDTYLTFYAKAATISQILTLKLNWATSYNVTIPTKWTYFRIKISDLTGLSSPLTTFVAQLNGTGQTIYLDDIMFIK